MKNRQLKLDCASFDLFSQKYYVGKSDITCCSWRTICCPRYISNQHSGYIYTELAGWRGHLNKFPMLHGENPLIIMMGRRGRVLSMGVDTHTHCADLGHTHTQKHMAETPLYVSNPLANSAYSAPCRVHDSRSVRPCELCRIVWTSSFANQIYIAKFDWKLLGSKKVNPIKPSNFSLLIAYCNAG